MAKNSDKEYKCPHCPQTSTRKYNINIHIQRKHRDPRINYSNQSAVFNELPNLKNVEKTVNNWNGSIEQRSTSAFLLSSDFSFYPNISYYYYKVKDDEEKERRESERRFHKTLVEYISKIVIPSLKLQYIQSNYNENIGYNPLFIDPKNMPIAHKIYKCHKCCMQTLKPFFDFQEIYPVNKFAHSCYYSNQQQQQQQKQYTDNNDFQIKIKISKLQEILLSVINYRLKSQSTLLKMILFPYDLIENALSLRLMIFLMDIMGNEGEYYQFRWLFELLENERFIDLGEIKSSQHWAKRAYYQDNDNNDGKFLADEGKYVTKLDKEELKQFINMTEGTFGLIKFKIDNNKTIYTFCYLPLVTEKTNSNSPISLL
jgi:hypothetical protein